MYVLSNDHQVIIDTLFSSYKLKGYIHEEEALNLISNYDVSLKDTEHLIGILLKLGVIFSTNIKQNDNDYSDFGFIDYEAIFNEIIKIDRKLKNIISYIKKIKPPQRNEFGNLYIQSKSGNTFARNRIIEMNMRQAVRHALYFSKKYSYPLEECIQDAFNGLVLGLEKFDINKSLNFPIHITWSIRQVLYREVLIGNYLIRSPIHLKEKLFKVFRLFKDKSEKYKTENKIKILKKIRRILTCSEKEAIVIFNYFKTNINIDYLIKAHYSDNCEYENLIMEKSTNSQLNIRLKSILSTIPSREKIVIFNRFGIDIPKPLTLDEIGEMLGVSRERIRQIEKKALRRLRHPKRQKHLINFFEYNVKELTDSDLPKNEKFLEK